MKVYLVCVTTDDRERRLWAAATARDDSIDRVLDQILEGWTARLLKENPRGDATANMAPGEVRELDGLSGACCLERASP